MVSLALALFAARITARRSLGKLAWAFSSLLFVVALAGCSGLSDIHQTGTGTPAGTYTLTVTAKSGTLSHPASYVLTVN